MKKVVMKQATHNRRALFYVPIHTSITEFAIALARTDGPQPALAPQAPPFVQARRATSLA